MELVARKADLVRELQFFQQIVERKNTIPILANVLIESNGNELTLLATDLEVALRSRCEAAVEKAGAVTLPAKKLYEVVRALPEADVRLETEKGGTGVKVSAERFESRMPTLPREDFPSLPEVGRRGEVDDQGQRAARDGGEDAVCDHRRRHALLPQRRALRPARRFDDAGGHRRPSPGARQRATRAGGQGRRGDQGDPPAQDAVGAGASAQRGDVDVQYERGENHLFFEIGPRLLISRMIDGQFPAYEKVIPKSNDKRIEFERDRLTSAVRRVAILSNERSRAVKFVLDKGKVEVTSSSPEFGEAREPLTDRIRRARRSRSASTRSTCSISST